MRSNSLDSILFQTAATKMINLLKYLFLTQKDTHQNQINPYLIPFGKTLHCSILFQATGKPSEGDFQRAGENSSILIVLHRTLIHFQYTHQQLTPVWMVTMLKNIDSLPCPQGQLSIIDWNRHAGVGQHRTDVRRGIVGSFEIMCVPSVLFGNKAFHERFKIGAGGWVPVFAHNQRGARMLDEEEAHTFLHSPATQLRANKIGDIMKPLAMSGDFQRGFIPVHIRGILSCINRVAAPYFLHQTLF